MNVALLARVNVRRESRTPVVKSSESVEPSPTEVRVASCSTSDREPDLRSRPRRLRMDQRTHHMTPKSPAGAMQVTWISCDPRASTTTDAGGFVEVFPSA